MVPQWFLLSVAVLALVGAGVWGRAGWLRLQSLRRLGDGAGREVTMVVQGAIARDVHAMALYLAVAVSMGLAATFGQRSHAAWWGLGLIAVPVVISVRLAQYNRRDARLTEERLRLEQRADEMLAQADAAPNRWAERLTPAALPDTPGYEVGTLHQAGAGVMSGDVLDVFHLPSGRLCCVVGDVSGHDVEASITALQTKFLLRSYLRRYRDPGQALEELNRQLCDYERPEEFMSVFVAIFDAEAEVLRFASAGHPAAWVCRDREVRPLRSTGPVLMMDRDATYLSREVRLGRGDVVVVPTDGLVEARNGDDFFGDERLAGQVRRNAEVAPAVLCKLLLDAASEFASGPVSDDVTVLAVRRG